MQNAKFQMQNAIDSTGRQGWQWWQGRVHNDHNQHQLCSLHLGSLRFAHLFFLNYSAQDVSILKISVAIIKRRSCGYKTPPTHKVWMIMSQVMTIPKNNVLRYLMICFVFGTNLSIKIIFGNFYFLLIAITWLKTSKLCKLGVFWKPQDLLLMMGTDILKIDASLVI